MDLRTLRTPAGPHPASVYWRRRVLVLVLLVVVVLLLARACTSGSGGAQRPTAGQTPATTPSATTHPRSPTASATTAAGRCPAASLRVTATTDATNYPAGVLPRLTLTVRNASGGTCSVAWGPALRKFTVLSGADRVWGTADCPQPQTVTQLTLAAGATRSATLTWSRHRSVPGCASEGRAASPGTYRFYAGLGDIVSDPAVFHLTS